MNLRSLEAIIRNGGRVVVSCEGPKIKASIYWVHRNEKIGGSPKGTLLEALHALDSRLQTSSAEKIIK